MKRLLASLLLAGALPLAWADGVALFLPDRQDAQTDAAVRAIKLEPGTIAVARISPINVYAVDARVIEVGKHRFVGGAGASIEGVTVWNGTTKDGSTLALYRGPGQIMSGTMQINSISYRIRRAGGQYAIVQLRDRGAGRDDTPGGKP